ncbi:hypothetical protein [Nubsella zeaxanthinifaciens]|uniref:hypothetical protein n=1 Tax=Nubsella zeaxanthinifaciens TaxID=392412 RepID=UPI001F3816D2|nr:hypothetical protein [Nubsella zeaxanthinifaciens]
MRGTACSDNSEKQSYNGGWINFVATLGLISSPLVVALGTENTEMYDWKRWFVYIMTNEFNSVYYTGINSDLRYGVW